MKMKKFFLIKNTKTDKYVYLEWSKEKKEYVLKETKKIKKALKYEITVYKNEVVAKRTVECFRINNNIDAMVVEVERTVVYKVKENG